MQIKGQMISGLLAFTIRLGSPAFVLAMIRLLNDYQKELDSQLTSTQQKLEFFPNATKPSKGEQKKEGNEGGDKKNDGWMPKPVRSLLKDLATQSRECDVSVPRGESMEGIANTVYVSHFKQNEQNAYTHAKRTTKAHMVIRDAGYQAAVLEHYGILAEDLRTNFTQRHQKISSGRGFTTDGQYLYVHCSSGLLKIDISHSNSNQWKLINSCSYRNSEQIQIVWVDGKLYSRSSNMSPGLVEVIDPYTLHVRVFSMHPHFVCLIASLDVILLKLIPLYIYTHTHTHIQIYTYMYMFITVTNVVQKIEDVHLGVNFDNSSPSRWRGRDLPMMTDGLYLYLVSHEQDWNHYYEQSQEMRNEIIAKKSQTVRKARTNIKAIKQRAMDLQKNSKETQTESVQTVTFDPIRMEGNIGREEKPISASNNESKEKEKEKSLEIDQLQNEQYVFKKRLLKVTQQKLSLVNIINQDAKKQDNRFDKKRVITELDENVIRNKFGVPPKRLVLYAYDVSRAEHIPVPDFPLGEPCPKPPPENVKKLQNRTAQAYSLSKKSKYLHDPFICYKALSLHNDDESNAINWLSANRDQSEKTRKVAPLARYIVCQPTPNVATDSNENMFNNCLFYCTGYQFVVLVPPHVQPWSSTDKHVARVYDMGDGSFIQDVLDITFHNHVRLTKACIDPLNNLIWGISIANDLILQSFPNHGPAAHFYEMPESVDNEPAPVAAPEANEKDNQEKEQQTAEAQLADDVNQLNIDFGSEQDTSDSSASGTDTDVSESDEPVPTTTEAKSSTVSQPVTDTTQKLNPSPVQ
ncbi:hypothetical protein RFI_17828, partial [Reticulomyxa filosa]